MIIIINPSCTVFLYNVFGTKQGCGAGAGGVQGAEAGAVIKFWLRLWVRNRSLIPQ
jgi:hypothetical protein